jgi:hypothetical protein
VALNKNKVFHDGSWCNYIATPYLGRARYYAKKLKLKNRQIDVRIWGKGKYVLQGSWL